MIVASVLYRQRKVTVYEYDAEDVRTVQVTGGIRTRLLNERRDDGEEYIYHYNHLGSALAVTNRNGEVVFRVIYGTYGELEDIRNAEGVSLLTAETAKGCTAAEVTDALGLEYLYNGQYGVIPFPTVMTSWATE